MKKSPQRTTGLVDELQSSHRFTVAVLVSVLLLSLATSGYLILVSQPRLANYVELAREARDVHEAMLDQETGLRGWLATDDPVFLEPYQDGRTHAAESVADLLHDVRSSPDVTDLVLSTLLARQEWQNWASEAAGKEYTPEQRTGGALERVPPGGQDALRHLPGPRHDQHRRHPGPPHRGAGPAEDALVVIFASYLLLLAGSAAITMRRRRRLQAVVLEPISDLHDTIGRLRDGDLTARAEATSVPELSEIGTALGQLAAELDEAGTEATAREIRLAFLANRFETVVRVGREIAGSLSIRYVSSTVTTAAADLLGTSATLWLRGDNHEFQVGAPQHRPARGRRARVAERPDRRTHRSRRRPAHHHGRAAGLPARARRTGHRGARGGDPDRRRRHRAGALVAALDGRRRAGVGAPAQHRP